MVTKGLNSERAEDVNDKKEQYKKGENKLGILIVNGHPAVRQGLTQLINQEADLGVCVEASSANQALEVVKKQQIDMAIVDISLEKTNSVHTAEKIRLRCPNLPVLIPSMRDEILYAQSTLESEAGEYIVNQEATTKIIKAVRYIQTLLRCQVFGFTVLVKVEGVRK